MKLTFVALRSILFAAGFLSLWTWVAVLLRRFDSLVGGTLPAPSRALGFGVLALGASLVTWCMGAFVVRGRGTPALFDSPRRLVAVGPYRYIRNPMYVGGTLLLLGFGLQQRSPSILLFVPFWWLLFHLLVIVIEEAVLRNKFGPDYEEYCRRTPRWFPRLGYRASATFTTLLLACVAFVHAPGQKPNFAGTWNFKADKSEFGLLPGPDRRTNQIERAELVLRLTSKQTTGDRESIGRWARRVDLSPCIVSFDETPFRLATLEKP